MQPPYYFNFTGDVGNNTIYPSLGTKALIVNYNDVVEIVYQGTNVGAAENHPMHLHGYSFYVVGTGSGNFNSKTDPKSYNLIDPPEVNTVGVPKNGWVTIRFIADNPGTFSIHTTRKMVFSDQVINDNELKIVTYNLLSATTIFRRC
jgi:laccase